MKSRFPILLTCLLAFGCSDDGKGSDDGSVQQTGQINTQADINNHLQAQGLHLTITNCKDVNIVTGDGTLVKSGAVSDVNSAIDFNELFGNISKEQAEAAKAVLEEALRNADCEPGD